MNKFGWNLALLGGALSALPSCALKRPAGDASAPPSEEIEYMRTEDNFDPVEVIPTDVPSPYFVKDGKPFCFKGTNNYYPMYKSEFAVKDVLDAAQAMNLGVLRIWSFIDRGSLDGSVKNVREPGHADGVYFQYWDHEKNEPAYNDGPDGLQRMDFILSEARKRDIALTMVLTNNWHDFGGMDQYLQWYGLTKHHEFYTNEKVKQAYKNWVTHIVNRVNSIDGVPYKDDPAIFAWEIANEPRTINYTAFDDPGWDKDVILKWADEMSTFIKTLDKNHMVAVGDEGFLNGGRNDWTYEAPFGVDNEALTALPNIDFGTYHMYPDHWGKGHKWGNDYVEDHIAMSRRVDKPVILEEYGIHIKREGEYKGPIVHGWERREVAYINWNNILMKRGGQGSMFWILSGYENPGQLYLDYDYFTVYKDDITFKLLKKYADGMKTEAAACTLAEGYDHGPLSKFITARPAPSGEETPASEPAPAEEEPANKSTDESASRALAPGRVPS